jgi:predicted transposase/invertase (TIGR01784 family)
MRLKVKSDLTRVLYERGMSRDEIIDFYRFIDWVIRLPKALTVQYNEVIDKIEEEKKVKILTSIEERGIQAGLLQGKQEGFLQGSQKEKSLVAKNMLDEGLSLDLIKKVTGLNELELMTLEKVEC